MKGKIMFKKVSLSKFIIIMVLMGGLFLAAPAPALPVSMDDVKGVEAAANLQRVFSTVSERASPAVVVITNKQVQQNRGIEDLPPAFRFFFGMPEPQQQPRDDTPQVPQPTGRGSGVIVAGEGYVLTNYHVIKDYDELELMLHDDTVYSTADDDLEVVGVDSSTDLAVLKIKDEEKDQFPYLDFADTGELKVGDWTIAVGAPFDFDYSVTVGVVSQKGRHNMGLHTFENYIQTDASINPGNSGGPLVNIYGEIIGINNFIVTGGGFSRGNSGVGFAIDGSLAREIADSIIADGKVVRPWLGISMQELGEELQREFGVERGVLINEALEGEPAEEHGVKAGDVLLEVGGERVETPRDVQIEVLNYDPGDTIELLINRNGEEMTIEVVAGERDPSGERSAMADQNVLKDVGLHLDTIRQGAVGIVGVAGNSFAAKAGLRRGDIILEVNREEVNSVDEVRKALQATRGGAAVLYIERRGSRFFVPLQVPQSE